MSPRAFSRACTAQYTFSSSSPDEIALCESLDRCGLTMTERKGNVITVRYVPVCSSSGGSISAPAGGCASSSPSNAVGVGARFFRYAIRATLDFTSTRARMDVLAQTPDGSWKVFVKGSDQQVLRMVTASAASATAGGAGAQGQGYGYPPHTHTDAQSLIELTSLQLASFAKTGSRTLLMAGRTLSPAEGAGFMERYNDAANSLADRENEIESVFRELEAEQLVLLGASAVEDQLQDGVPDAVDFLLRGGLSLIILTGDKLETALSIGHQSRLLQPYMSVLQIGASASEESIAAMLQENVRIVIASPPTDSTAEVAAVARAKHQGGAGAAAAAAASPSSPPTAQQHGYALAIDGSSLEVCLTHHLDSFLLLFAHCATIIAYRSTPRQKEMVVSTIKTSLGKTTLAIGDGANDVRARGGT